MSNNKQLSSIYFLDKMIDDFGIIDNETEMPPVSDEERATIKLQLLYSQILARDTKEIKKHNESLSNKPGLFNSRKTNC